MEQSMQLRHQNYMWAVRAELGWPPFRPACDSVAFSAGRTFDVAVGMDLARHAQEARKDFIYAGWASPTAREPDGIAVVLRELLSVDVVTRAVLWAADETSLLAIISTRGDEHFVVGQRGLIERRPGKPNGLARGRKIASRRTLRTAAAMSDAICPRNTWVPNGGTWAEPAGEPQGMVVRFN